MLRPRMDGRVVDFSGRSRGFGSGTHPSRWPPRERRLPGFSTIGGRAHGLCHWPDCKGGAPARPDLRTDSSGPVALDPRAELSEAILDSGQAVEIAPGAGLGHELHEAIPLLVELGVSARVGPGSKRNQDSASLMAGCGRWRRIVPMDHAPSMREPSGLTVRQMV